MQHVRELTATRLPVSTEARGLARDFCRRVAHEARMINEQEIGGPLRRRIARHPDRRPRDDVLRDLERRWREAHPQRFRLEFRSTRDGRDVFISERAVTMLDAFRLPHWDSNDYGVVVLDTWLAVSRGRPSAGVRSRMWIGSHALARWYQRSAATSDEHLLRDIALGAALDASDPSLAADMENVRVPVSATAEWRGAIMLAPEDEGDEFVFHAKTFV